MHVMLITLYNEIYFTRTDVWIRTIYRIAIDAMFSSKQLRS